MQIGTTYCSSTCDDPVALQDRARSRKLAFQEPPRLLLWLVKQKMLAYSAGRCQSVPWIRSRGTGCQEPEMCRATS